MAKQRDQIRMTPQEVEAFLDEVRSMTMCTINADGTIHAVAMWYGLLDGVVAFETKAKSQKAVNLRRDSRITCLVEAGTVYEELRGVSLVGYAEIIDDPDQMFELGKSVVSRHVAPYTEDLRPVVEMMLRNRVVIKVHVDNEISWDHRKL